MASKEQNPPPSLWSWFRSHPGKNLPEVLLMDGGVSTHLEAMIAPKKFSHRSLWSSSLLLTEEGRESILQGHRVWLDAGSDILTTVTYQCHYGLFRGSSCNGAACENESQESKTEVLSEEKSREMMIGGVALAKQAIHAAAGTPTPSTETSSIRPGPFVVASTGPYGAAMADGSEYTGKYPAHVGREKLVEFHTRKAKTLMLGGKPDGLAIETIPNLEEVGVVCEVLRNLQRDREASRPDSPPIACWISLACRNGRQMNDGHTLEEALRIVRSYDPTGKWIVGVGINCFDSSYLSSLVTTLIKETRLDGSNRRRGIVIYPNTGEAWDAANEKWKDGSGTTDDELTDRLMESVQLIRDACEVEICANQRTSVAKTSATGGLPKIVLGGCCRTNPATIAKLREKIDACV